MFGSGITCEVVGGLLRPRAVHRKAPAEYSSTSPKVTPQPAAPHRKKPTAATLLSTTMKAIVETSPCDTTNLPLRMFCAPLAQISTPHILVPREVGTG